MRNGLQVFNNSEFGKVTTLEIDNEIYFLGKEAALILGYTTPTDAILDHVDEEDRKCLTFKAFGKTVKALWSGNDFSNKWIINESGLYALIFRSEMPNAKKFKHWVTSEVLPSIRKTGSYSVQQSTPSFQIEDSIERALAWIEEEKVRRQLLLENTEMKPKVEFYDDLVERKHLTGIRDTAKELGIKTTEFVYWLLEHGYLYRTPRKVLKPYAKYVGSYFEMKDTKNGKTGYTCIQTMITVEGKQHFNKLLNK